MALPRLVAVCSYRLGGTDGVSIEAAKWVWALRELGCQVRTVAGEGTADRLVPGLRRDASEAPQTTALEAAFADCDLVIVENLCSLPLNHAASHAVAEVLAGRPALLHHHDLALERSELAHLGPPPNDPSWIHVCVSRHAAATLARYRISATTIYNRFDLESGAGDRERCRSLFGLSRNDKLVLQPTRAIPRKQVGRGLAVAERLRASFWLTGPAEDGYDAELARLLSHATCRVLRQSMGDARCSVADAYAGCDLVVLPSSWEGFGNPAIEAAIYRRPLVIGSYPVASELSSLGFSWLALNNDDAIASFIERPDRSLLEHNHQIAARHFALADLPKRLCDVLHQPTSPSTIA